MKCPGFADKIGQSRDTLSAWESGRNTPRGIVAIAKRIELAYGVPASWTLGLQEAPPRPDGPEGGARWAHWGSNPEPTGSPCDLVTNVVPLLASFTQHPEHDLEEVA